MFGDLMGMMGKLRETQEKVAATRERLKTVIIEESRPDGSIEIMVNAMREVVDIRISDELLADKEQLADYLVIHLNNALRRAGEIQEAELGSVAREGMPNIPGLDQLLK